ncbi:MAG: response regulator [bacterium]|nr:response regulator [bacterium]
MEKKILQLKQNGKLLVLIIDDSDEDFFLFEREILKGLGYFTCLHVDNGPEGIELFRMRQTEIGVVVTDYKMPRMNGLEVIAEIRKISSKIPLIMVSGDITDQYCDLAQKALLAGADEAVQKPCSEMRFAKAVISAVEKRHV